MSAYGLVQTTTQLAQLSQLADLNAHLRAQQQAEALQANLGQALFETERMAKRVSLTLTQDPFAAAILSYDWLKLVEGIRPELFNAIEHKRAWSDSHDVLANIYRRVELDPVLAGQVGRYLQYRGSVSDGLFELGNEPRAYLAQATHRASVAVQGRTKLERQARYAGMGAGALAFLWLVSSLSDAAGFFGFLFVVGIGYLVLKLSALGQAKAAAHQSLERLAYATQRVEAFEAFMHDANAGGFVQKAWQEHPLLFNEPIPQAPGVSDDHRASALPVQTFVERQVVERQVVVTRCRFCNQMTPVDRPECQRCGAPGYGG